MHTTHLRQHIRAPRAAVYQALLDPDAVAHWKVPDGMTAVVHEWDAREGGALRVSLTYDVDAGTGKSSSQTDTYRGRFVTLVPDERIVEIDEFETDDPAMRGAMTSTITLADADGGTALEALHEGVPDAVSPEDNLLGWRLALAKLARLVEGDGGG